MVLDMITINICSCINSTVVHECAQFDGDIFIWFRVIKKQFSTNFQTKLQHLHETDSWDVNRCKLVSSWRKMDVFKPCDLSVVPDTYSNTYKSIYIVKPLYILYNVLIFLKKNTTTLWVQQQIDGLVQDCSISSELAMEILQSYTKPSKCLVMISKTIHPFYV